MIKLDTILEKEDSKYEFNDEYNNMYVNLLKTKFENINNYIEVYHSETLFDIKNYLERL
jgi:hypothetical protein